MTTFEDHIARLLQDEAGTAPRFEGLDIAPRRIETPTTPVAPLASDGRRIAVMAAAAVVAVAVSVPAVEWAMDTRDGAATPAGQADESRTSVVPGQSDPSPSTSALVNETVEELAPFRDQRGFAGITVGEGLTVTVAWFGPPPGDLERRLGRQDNGVELNLTAASFTSVRAGELIVDIQELADTNGVDLLSAGPSTGMDAIVVEINQREFPPDSSNVSAFEEDAQRFAVPVTIEYLDGAFADRNSPR